MKKLLIIAIAFMNFSAFAQSLNLNTLVLPFKNGPATMPTYRFADFKGKVHVFEAFGIRCSWCMRNAPQVAEMANEYASDARVQFIDLGLDRSDRDFQSWIMSHRPKYPVLADVNREVFNAFARSQGIPQTFVMDCNGQYVGGTAGFWSNTEKEQIREYISTALKAVCQ